MKDNKKQSIGQIKDAIINKKESVIKALIKSNIDVDLKVSDDDLFDIIISELKKGNGYLVFYLSLIISGEDKNIKSNAAGAVGAATTIASSLFGFLSDRNNAAAVKAQADAAQKQYETQLEIEKIRKETALLTTPDDSKKSGSNLIVISSIIGGVVVLGLVATIIIVTRKNK